MMPQTQALQVFYGTIPLILVLLTIWLREQTLLKDILARLGRIESKLEGHSERIAKVEERTALIR